MFVKPKKALGQHFLKDLNIAQKITASLTGFGGYKHVLEIGPGMGVLTKYLLQNTQYQTVVAEIDRESVAYLKAHLLKDEQIIEGDFLELDLAKVLPTPLGIIGNLPYNISSQIFFKILENKDLVPETVAMIQKEVAERMAAKPNSKANGILSILMQTFYDIEYLFTVPPQVFNPPPKVQSAVIRLQRNQRNALPCSEKLFFRVVKQAFNMRRKTMRNSLKPLGLSNELLADSVFDKRAEQLNVDEFIALSTRIENDLKRT